MNRMESIESFEVINYSGTPDTQFISTKKNARTKLYNEFLDEGIELPSYSAFKRKNLRKRDMMVLNEDWFMEFVYKGVKYRIDAKKGACFDGASVPTIFIFGNMSRFNQYVIIPALVHDILFATHKFSFEDANNIFSALLRWNEINKCVLAKYMLGVRVGGKGIYNRSVPEDHWLWNFSECKVIS